MITKKMAKWLESLPKNPKRRPKYCTYMSRIQKKIDKELNELIWLAVNYPDVFKNKRYTAYGKLRKGDKENERLKKLLLVVKALNPSCDVELVLENLEFGD
jgi:hypothetical protein